MSGPQLRLDFAGPRIRTTPVGVVLLLFGLSAVTLAGLEYRATTMKRAGLEVRLAEALRRSSRSPLESAQAARLSAEAAGIARELGTPWTAVLADLETASRASEGKISVLSLEPDHEKHRVLIKAEAKDLPLALAYLHRLQASRSLRFPMLDSHEVIADDKDHPVRFAMTASWREAP